LESKLGVDKGGEKGVGGGGWVERYIVMFFLYFVFKQLIGPDLMTWADSFVAPMTEVICLIYKYDLLLSDEKDAEINSEDYDGEVWHGIGKSVEHFDPESDYEMNTPTSSYFWHETWC
jgi:hypothetical protein